ncbi:fibronectin type III domain-containing protein [Christiangramia sediminis]|uniref:Fibronectin type III domain-containing protein n=1 Tax=Christiangramia sediminis TaxID=2881336 RepID=A0A9X1LLG2_9FLAO|nr:fibronectin type III domain-containing protein [Christiangramia sediminis]MCB7482575.1 fibronectin type III domain-containing protein [Christiangramia sediminis]
MNTLLYRVFGSSEENFEINRKTDRRDARLSWQPVEEAMGYVIYWGISKDKLNNSVMIYDASSYELRALNADVEYYFAVEAFNENGVGKRSEPIRIN